VRDAIVIGRHFGGCSLLQAFPDVDTVTPTSVGSLRLIILVTHSTQMTHANMARSNTRIVPNSFYVGCEDIKATRQFVLYLGTEELKCDSQTEGMPLQTFSMDLLLERV
jgi:hypothetical protein